MFDALHIWQWNKISFQIFLFYVKLQFHFKLEN